uniref:Uncharacterized protein n=1 Tax=Acrobeloides nanus TaxID=290746 RepID=A0A914CAL6_9BILA
MKIFREARAGESAEVENEPNGVIVEEPQTVETSFMNGNLHKNEQEIPKPVPVKRLSIDGQITSKISKNKILPRNASLDNDVETPEVDLSVFETQRLPPTARLPPLKTQPQPSTSKTLHDIPEDHSTEKHLHPLKEEPATTTITAIIENEVPPGFIPEDRPPESDSRVENDAVVHKNTEDDEIILDPIVEDQDEQKNEHMKEWNDAKSI